MGLYILSLCIALSPIGEWLLRMQNGCKEMTNKEELDRLQPLFDEVYQKSKMANPELPNNIKMFISDDDSPNAFTTGRKTVCVTRGLLKYTDEQIKGVLAHEFGHLAHKDTDAILVISVGNMIVSALFVIIRVLANISFGIANIMTAFMGEGLGSLFGFIFVTMGKIVADLLLTALIWLWTKLGILLCMYSSRQNEYLADKYAFDRGYGDELSSALQDLSGGSSNSKGLFANLVSSHPDTDKRIAKLNELANGNSQLLS